MATTKKPTGTATRKPRTARTTRNAASRSATTHRETADPGIVASAGKTIKRNPIASAAVAASAVGAVAAAAAGFLAFRKSGKSFTDFSNDAVANAKDKAAEVTNRVKDGLADASTIAKDKVAKLRDGIDGATKSQSDFAEEALTLKETGAKVDPLIDEQSKVGSVSY